MRAPRRPRERGLPGSRAPVAGPRVWPRRDTPLPVPRPPSASLLAQGASALLSSRANRPPRSHRFLNHCRSIYWEQTNSPFWKRFNCWLDGWGAAAGGRAGPRGAREGACGKKREYQGPAPLATRASCLHARASRHGSPCTSISRHSQASLRVQHPLAAGAQRPALPPCHVQASSTGFLIPL